MKYQSCGKLARNTALSTGLPASGIQPGATGDHVATANFWPAGDGQRGHGHLNPAFFQPALL